MLDCSLSRPGRHLRSAAAAPSPVDRVAHHPTARILSQVRAMGRCLPTLSCHCCHHCQVQRQREELSRGLVSVNCIYALGRGGKKGNLKISDTENGIYRDERLLGEGEPDISAA